MLRRKSKYTIIEIMIAVVIVGILTNVFIAAAGRGCSGGPNTHAEEGARRWASDLGIDVRGVNCTGMDTDGDGYVSCTVATKDGQVHAIECASGWSITSGCRSPKVNIPFRRRPY